MVNHFIENFTDIKSLLRKIFEDWKSVLNSEQRLIVQENAKASKRIVNIILTLSYCNLVTSILGEFLLLLQKQAKTGKRDMLFLSYFPFNAYKSPQFELVWALQSIGITLATFAAVGHDCFFGVMVMHLCGQLAVLKNDLTNLENSKTRVNVNKCIVYVARRHGQLIR